MSWLDGLNVWQLAIAIFFLRIVDVSVGTLRTITVVQGRTFISAGLGFIEVLVWITVVSKVIQQAGEHPLLLLTYACGFATGNAVGICLERWLAQGSVVLRFVTTTAGDALKEVFHEKVAQIFSFEGKNSTAPMTMVYLVARRRDVPQLVSLARKLDREVYYAVEPLRESSHLYRYRAPWPIISRGMTKSK